MATTGELLVEMSTLTSATALDHFLNIEFGGTSPVPCPDPVPCPECPECPECPDILDCPDPDCPDCPPVDGYKLPNGKQESLVGTGPGNVNVIEDMNINVEVLDNYVDFCVENTVEEMDIILNIVPNTVKIDLEWL